MGQRKSEHNGRETVVLAQWGGGGQTRDLAGCDAEVVLRRRQRIVERAEHLAVLGVDVGAAVHKPHRQHVKLVLHKVVQRGRLVAVLHVQVCPALHQQLHNLSTHTGTRHSQDTLQ